MQSLADAWIRSGKNSKCLHPGSKEEIITELKSWVERRKTLNNTKFAERWHVFAAAHLQKQIAALRKSNQGKDDQAVCDQIANRLAVRDRYEAPLWRLQKEQDRENLLADFFLASLRHRGVRWRPTRCREDRQAEASVCACLGVVDPGFDSKKEQEILEDKARGAQWLEQYESACALDIAEDPVSGVHSYPAAIYTADLLGDTDVAAGETNPGTENHIGYKADTLGKITIATPPSSPSSKDTQNTAGPSSDTVTGTGLESQNTPETEGRDEVGKMSKAKKTRERKKRAKARAKEAAANAEVIVDNNDNDDSDGDVPDLVDTSIASHT